MAVLSLMQARYLYRAARNLRIIDARLDVNVNVSPPDATACMVRVQTHPGGEISVEMAWPICSNELYSTLTAFGRAYGVVLTESPAPLEVERHPGLTVVGGGARVGWGGVKELFGKEKQ